MKRILMTSVAACALVGAAQSADLGTMPIKAPPVAAAPAPLWSGAYIGLQGGVARHRGWFNDLDRVFFGIDDTTTKTGGTFGGHIGYNWQIQRVVLGIEGDGSWVWAKASDVFCSPFVSCAAGGMVTHTQEVSWLATVRGRLGVAVLDSTLLYITGGAAFAHVKNRADGYLAAGPLFTSFVDEKTKSGWVAGGGIEQMIGRNWTVRGEVRWFGFGHDTVTATGGTCGAGCAAKRGEFSNSLMMGLVGASYRF